VVIAGDQRDPDFPSYLTRGRRGIGTARLAHSLTAWWALKHQDVFPARTPHLARNPAWSFAASIRPDSGYLYRGCRCLSNHLSHLSELCDSYPSRAHLVTITGWDCGRRRPVLAPPHRSRARRRAERERKQRRRRPGFVFTPITSKNSAPNSLPVPDFRRGPSILLGQTSVPRPCW
jgi:hypothetical protein